MNCSGERLFGCEMVLAARLKEQSSLGDKGGSPSLSPAGNAAEAPPRGEPLKCKVECVSGNVDGFRCLSAKNACRSSDRQSDDFRAH